MGKDQLQSWQEGARRVLTTRLDEHAGRRAIFLSAAALSASFMAACRPPKLEVSLTGDAPAGPPPEPRFDLENDPSLSSPEDIFVRLIQSTFRPRYQGVFAADSVIGVQVLSQNFQRTGISPNFSPTPNEVRKYNHYLAHPTYIGAIRGGEFSKDRPSPDAITYANFNMSFEPDNTWSRLSITGGSSLDKIPEISNSVQKTVKTDGETLYEIPADKLNQAADLLMVLPRNAQRTFIPKTPGNPSTADRWDIQGSYQPESTNVSARFRIYKERGVWSLELTRPHHTPIPQT